MPVRTLVAGLALVLVCGVARGGAGAELPPEELIAPQPANLPLDEQPRRVVLLPVKDLSGRQATLARQAGRLLRAAYAQSPRVTLVVDDGLAARVLQAPDYPEKLRWAREFARLGRQDYERIRLAEAVKHLRLAAQTFQSIHHDVIAPREVSQTLLTLAKAYLERNDEGPAEQAFAELLAVDPSIQLSPEQFSPTVIASFDKARYHAAQGGGLGQGSEKAVALGRLASADYVVLPTLRPRPEAGASALGVWQFELRRGLPVAPEQQVPAAPPEVFADEVGRLVSRLLACMPNTEFLAAQRDPDRFRPQVLLDTSFEHLTYLQHPLQSSFQNMGLSVGLGWAPQEHLLLQARLLMTASRNNSPYDDLLDPLRMLRLLVTAGIAKLERRWGVYTATGLDLSWPFAFRYSHEADCKWHEPQPSQCDELVLKHSPGLVLGLHVGAGAHWLVAPPVLLRLRVGLSYAFLPTEDNELNLPLDADLGLGYRF